MVSSVLPTPVGPRKMNEPIGRFGSCSPARARRTALETAWTASALADDPLGEFVFHAQELVALAFQHLVDGNAGPARDDVGNVVGRDDFLDHRAGIAALLCLDEFLFQVGDAAIGQFAGLLELALALGGGEFVAGFVELALQVGGGAELFLFCLPRVAVMPVRFLLEAGQFLLQLRQPVASRPRPSPTFSASRSIFSCMMRRSISSRASGLESTCMRRRDGGLVDEVDRLVRQEAVGDVPVGQASPQHTRAESETRTLWCCSYFSLRPRRIEIGVLDGRLLDEDRLEAAGERRVLLDVLAVLVERGRADAVQFPAREGGLQQVGRVHSAVGLARADERVHLVDEQDDAAGRGLDFPEDGLQALLELAAVLRAGDQRRPCRAPSAACP